MGLVADESVRLLLNASNSTHPNVGNTRMTFH